MRKTLHHPFHAHVHHIKIKCPPVSFVTDGDTFINCLNGTFLSTAVLHNVLLRWLFSPMAIFIVCKYTMRNKITEKDSLSCVRTRLIDNKKWNIKWPLAISINQSSLVKAREIKWQKKIFMAFLCGGRVLKLIN